MLHKQLNIHKNYVTVLNCLLGSGDSCATAMVFARVDRTVTTANCSSWHEVSFRNWHSTWNSKEFSCNSTTTTIRKRDWHIIQLNKELLEMARWKTFSGYNKKPTEKITHTLIPLSQWCILHFPPICTKFINLHISTKCIHFPPISAKIYTFSPISKNLLFWFNLRFYCFLPVLTMMHLHVMDASGQKCTIDSAHQIK